MISETIATIFINELELSEEDSEFLRYGIDSLLCDFTDFMTVLLISLFLRNTFQTVIYITLLSILRTYCGGYHARTKSGCLAVYTAMYLLACVFHHYLTNITVFLLFLSAAAYTFFNAPVEHVCLPLTPEERDKSKSTVRKILMIISLLLPGCCIFSKSIFKTIVITMVNNAVFMELLKHSREWRKDYEA